MNFKKPAKAKIRYPPVIDPFSRTLAAPISSERHYFSVCHKIGSNFTPTSKGFFIDTDSRTIKYKNANEGTTKLSIVSEKAIEPADEQEEYEAALNPKAANMERIKARQDSYKR